MKALKFIERDFVLLLALLHFSPGLVPLTASSQQDKPRKDPTAAQEEKQPVIYVRHLVPPRGYPPLARQTRLGGTIVIKLAITAEGTVLNVESAPGDKNTIGFPILRDDAEKLVKKWTFGCARCAANAPFEHTIKFNYRLDSEDLLPDNLVIMNLPDEVTIYSSPPPCDHCPSPKPSKKGNR